MLNSKSVIEKVEFYYRLKFMFINIIKKMIHD